MTKPSRQLPTSDEAVIREKKPRRPCIGHRYRVTTRAPLNPFELAREIGPLTIPPPSDATTEQQPATNSAR